MENLNNVPSSGTYGGAINEVNHNFSLVKGAIDGLEGRTIRSKGLFPTVAALNAAYPSPIVGDYAYVGSGLPAEIYDCVTAGTWHDTGQTGGSETINLGDYSTTTQMNAAIDSGLQGQVGYAVCSTAGATKRKDVVVSGFKLLANGGALHIKMTTANTNASATMNISPTSTVVAANTKPLFYNGEQATAENTWDANEILSIYYDGTNYQATNSQGGGGKAEKIKYDNSQSGLTATNVQEAVDKIVEEIISYTPVYDDDKFSFSTTSKAKSAYYIRAIPFVQGGIYRLTFTLDDVKENNVDLYLANSSNKSATGLARIRIGTIKAGSNTEIIDYTCNDATMIYPSINCTVATSGSLSILVEKQSYISTEINDVQETTDELYNKIKEVDEKADKIEEIILPSTDINYRIIAGTGKFSTKTTDKHIFYRVVPGATYKVIVKPNAVFFHYAWTIDNYSSYNALPHYCSGESDNHSISAGSVKFITAPQDAKYICITTKYEGRDTRPEYFGRFYYLAERVDILEEVEDSLKEVVTEIDISENVYPNIRYYLWENSNNFSTKTNGTHINIPIVGGATYRMVCPIKTAYAFVTDAKIGTAYGSTPNYCIGETVHIVSAGTYTITAPQDARFITITTSVNGSTANLRPTYFAKVEKIADQLSYNTKVIQDDVKSSDALQFNYYGEKIDLNPKYGLMAVNIAFTSGLQSSACYGDYIVSINKGMTKMCLQKMTNYLYITTNIIPPADNTSKYHGNQCNFGNQKYDENDYLPVLYASCFGSDRENTSCVLVYRIIPTFNEETGEISNFTASIVQTIYLPQSQEGVFYGGNSNIAIDRQRNMMYAYHGTGAGYDGTTLITRFSKIPPLFDANNEPISVVEFGYTKSDNPNYYMARTFEIPIGSYTNQGGAIWNGKLYIARGGAAYNYVDLYCIDLIQERLVSWINLKEAQEIKAKELGGNNWKFEPEGLFIWKNNIYISTNLSTILKVLL